jgi:hypothetical protein
MAWASSFMSDSTLAEFNDLVLFMSSLLHGLFHALACFIVGQYLGKWCPEHTSPMIELTSSNGFECYMLIETLDMASLSLGKSNSETWPSSSIERVLCLSSHESHHAVIALIFSKILSTASMLIYHSSSRFSFVISLFITSIRCSSLFLHMCSFYDCCCNSVFMHPSVAIEFLL